MNIKTQRAISLGLSLVNVAGVIGTFIFVMRETPKAQTKLNNLPKNTKKTKKVKTFIVSYKKSLIFASAAVLSGVGARIINAKTEASLLATIGMLDASLHKYKTKVKQTLGIDADKNIIKSIMKDECKDFDIKPEGTEELYYEEHIGYFYAKPEKIVESYIKINEQLNGCTEYYASCYVTIKDFLDFCEGRPLSHNLSQSALNFGWGCDYLCEWFEYCWVHFDVDNVDECGAHLIYWHEDPVWNPIEWYDFVYGNLPGSDYWKNCDGKVDMNSYVYNPYREKVLEVNK